MKKVIFTLMVICLFSLNINAKESENNSQLPSLLKTYQREIAFLTAQKRSLEKRLKEIDFEYNKKTKSVKTIISQKQNELVDLTRKNELLDQKLLEAEKNLESKDESASLLDTTILQAATSLDLKIEETLELNKKIDLIFSSATKILNEQSSITKIDEKFFDMNGILKNGEVIKIGRIAKYAIHNKQLIPLIPVGEGRFRMSDDLFDIDKFNKQDQSLPIFLYESDQKGMEIKKEKGILDTLEAGGSIAYVIAVLGLLALGLVGIRYYLLMRAGKINQDEIKNAEKSLKSDDLKGDFALNRVLRKILLSENLERDAREDIISESILAEISIIDKFGAMILVMAAVAPLLGLLGTVTGMISTFDIITEFGTGDPKMLSSGISEALITTKLGLIVAIPTLLFGNMLTAKASKIKLALECEALKFSNLIESKKELV